MVEFTKDTIISQVLEEAPGAAPVFFAIGMHCLGCAMASGETIERLAPFMVSILTIFSKF